MSIKVAIIATSHALMGDGGMSASTEAEQTGVWLEEITTPYYALKDAGVEVDVYSMQGGEIPIDPRSVSDEGEREESVQRYMSDEQTQALFSNTKPLSAVNGADYDGIFLPGGHGTMWDYPNSDELANLIANTLQRGAPVAAVCHGPAALVAVKDDSGEPMIRGKQVAGFTNSEERATGLEDAVPFLLETRLKELGANYQSGPDFEPFAVRDGLLITGQNPASAGVTVEHLLTAMREVKGN